MNLHDSWMTIVRAGIRGVAEAFFPENDLGAPNWREADVVERTVAWLEDVPPPNRQLVMLLFTFLELASAALIPGTIRFSKADVDKRLALIESLLSSKVYYVRIVGDALKATFTMIYLSHPDVLRHVGMFKNCEYPLDPLKVEIRKNALDEDLT